MSLAVMRRLGPDARYRKRVVSRTHLAHPVFPYLLQGLVIERANQACAVAITHIPMHRSFLYLTAVVDWASRCVLSLYTDTLSNTLSADFCCDALEQALTDYGAPEIFNIDQSCQFTSHTFIELLQKHNLQISMHGRGAYHDNAFVE
jgi:putative transposase